MPIVHKLCSTRYRTNRHKICLYSYTLLGILPPSKIEQTKDFYNIHFIEISLEYALE